MICQSANFIMLTKFNLGFNLSKNEVSLPCRPSPRHLFGFVHQLGQVHVSLGTRPGVLQAGAEQEGLSGLSTPGPLCTQCADFQGKGKNGTFS